MKQILLISISLLIVGFLTACGGSRIGSTDKIPESGFLQAVTASAGYAPRRANVALS